MSYTHIKHFFIIILTLSVHTQSFCAADPEQELNDKYETFKAVKNIQKIVAELTEEFKTPEFRLKDGSEWPEPNPYLYRTKQGLFLYITGRPDILATPWGEVKLNGGDAVNYAQSAAFSLAFAQKVSVQLSHIPTKPKYPYDKPTWHTIDENAPHMWEESKTHGTSFEWNDIYHEISLEQALTKIGTSCLLRGDLLNPTYKIISIDGKEVVEPIKDSEIGWDARKKILREWQELKHRYQHEQGE